MFGKKQEEKDLSHSAVLASQRALDKKFGELVEAEVASSFEQNSKPVSLHTLNQDNSILLAKMMETATEGLKITAILHYQTPILWVVDREGNFRFSLEEVITKDNFRFLRPRLLSVKPSGDEARLGHPALLDEKVGRIGGEIVFDPGWGAIWPGWKITNLSGRYGTVHGRTSKHLENVVTLLESHGVKVDPIFFPTRKS